MIIISKTTIIYPNFVAKSILDISAVRLLEADITHLALDVDDTLVPRNGNILKEEYIKHLRDLEKAGIILIIASNSRRDFASITRHLNARVVSPTTPIFKPWKSYYKLLIKIAGVKPQNIAMAGDNIVNDIIGANLACLQSIFVYPLDRKHGPITRWYKNKLK